MTLEAPEVRKSADTTLRDLSRVDGYVGACIVDSETGSMLAGEGGANVDLEIAAAGNTELVRAKRATLRSLQLDEGIEDILITLDSQYHLIRPLRGNMALFLYVVLDKSRANLAMARHVLARAERDLQRSG